MKNIVDLPIDTEKSDSLGVDRYKSALVEYIKNCDTPMTISIQGEWGSGKTSLMNMIKYRVEYPHIWINTWEYSILDEESDISVAIVESIVDEMLDMVSQKSGKFRDKVAKYKKEIQSIGGSLAKGATRLALTIGAGAEDTQGLDEMTNINTSKSLKSLKDELQKLVDRVIHEFCGSEGKIVIFIDDLDRLPPYTAVKILEVLKNVFDINNTLFVLAIDYDVVVKGLKEKFGDSEANEREYRQFFDKIIQLPFSLPINSYDLSGFLDDILVQKIKYFTQDEYNTNFEYIQKIVNYTFGKNPRALKRVANYLSLISYINPDKVDTDMKLISFTLIAIQINYPFLYDLIACKSDFLSWEESDFENRYIKLDNEMTIKEEFDDEWEQQLLKAILSTKNRYFMEKSFDISSLLNLIVEKFGENYSEYITKGLDISSITSISISNNNETTTDLSAYWSRLKESIDTINPKLKGRQKIKLDKWSMSLAINSKSSKIEIQRSMQNSTWQSILEYISENSIDGLESLDQTKRDKKLTFLLDSGYKEFDPNSSEYIEFFTQKYKILSNIVEKFN
jgi:hypothetical protein